MTLKQRLTTLTFCVLAAGTAFSECAANKAAPPPNKSEAVPLKITGNSRATTSRLVIPRKFLREARVISSNDTGTVNLRTILAGLVGGSLALCGAVAMILDRPMWESRGTAASHGSPPGRTRPYTPSD